MPSRLIRRAGGLTLGVTTGVPMKPAYPTVGASIAGPPELGDLRLDSVLGSGAFGIVFRASPLNGSGSVAVKFLQAGVLADAHERQALFNEVLAAASVEHEHVIRMLFANLESEQYPPYVVTEFADRGTLQDRLDEAIRTKTLIPLEVVAEWSNQLVAAMQAINARVLLLQRMFFCRQTIWPRVT